MDTCDYCGATFDEESALVEHLGAEHQDELGPIDERRVASQVDDGATGLPTGPLILGGVIVAALLLVAFVIFGMGGSSSTSINGIAVSQQADATGTAHEHGTINVTIHGERIDFSQPQYQAPSGEFSGNKFHFEGGSGTVWHTHARGVTLEYAMATLGIEIERNAIVVDGETYTDSGDTTVVVEVNGQAVDPSSYVLQGVPGASGSGGDHIRIVVREAS